MAVAGGKESFGAGSPRYPAWVESRLRGQVPAALRAVGNLAAPVGGTLAFFCSVKCPGGPILQSYDLARLLRDAGITVIGGFQSPVEKDCLDLLLRGTQPVIICPARSLHSMRLPSEWKRAVAQGRLLLLSPFEERFRRPTAALAEKRNEFVAFLADEVLFAYAEPGGKTEALAKKVIASGKPVLTLDSKENAHLVALGAKPILPDAFGSQLSKRCDAEQQTRILQSA